MCRRGLSRNCAAVLQAGLPKGGTPGARTPGLGHGKETGLGASFIFDYGPQDRGAEKPFTRGARTGAPKPTDFSDT